MKKNTKPDTPWLHSSTVKPTFLCEYDRPGNPYVSQSLHSLCKFEGPNEIVWIEDGNTYTCTCDCHTKKEEKPDQSTE